MYSLYIDTHFVNLVMGLFKDDELVVKKTKESNSHSKETIPMLETILNECNIDIKDIKEIIVVVGPGSFTGVRIGVVIAKMLSYTLNIPVKGVTYLEAMALNYNTNVVVGIKDRNGAFIGEFDSLHNLTKDYYYLSNKELENRQEEINFQDNVDLVKVKNYVKSKEVIPPHLLKPLYVKKIEVGI